MGKVSSDVMSAVRRWEVGEGEAEVATYLLLSAHEAHDSVVGQHVGRQLSHFDNVVVDLQLAVCRAAAGHISHVVRLACGVGWGGGGWLEAQRATGHMLEARGVSDAGPCLACARVAVFVFFFSRFTASPDRLQPAEQDDSRGRKEGRKKCKCRQG